MKNKKEWVWNDYHGASQIMPLHILGCPLVHL